MTVCAALLLILSVVNALDSFGVVRDGDGTLQEDLNQDLNETFGGIELSEPKPTLLTPPGDPAGSPPRTPLVTPPDPGNPRFRKLTHNKWNVELPGTPPSQTCKGKWEESNAGVCSSSCYMRYTFMVDEKLLEDREMLEACEEKAGMPYNNEVDIELCTESPCGLINRDAILDMPRTEEIRQVSEALVGVARPLSVLLVAIVLLLGVIGRMNLSWLPDAGVIMVIAAIFAIAVREIKFEGYTFSSYSREAIGHMVSPMMMLLFLPISIFEGGFNNQNKNWWSQFGYGCAFAVFGTLASAFLLAFFIVQTGPNGLEWHPIATYREALCYSAFIADLDPVATLAAFGKLRVDALLSTLVSGEATLNDPVAIVMFTILNQKTYGRDELNPGQAVMDGFFLLVWSILLGIALGVLFTFLQRICSLRGNETIEAMFLFTSAYALFNIGEMMKTLTDDAVECSGIIVCLFGAIIMGLYAKRNIAESQREKIGTALNTMARVADMCIFAAVGLCCFFFRPQSAHRDTRRSESGRIGRKIVTSFDKFFSQSGISFGLQTILFCCIVRAIVLVIMIPPINAFKKWRGYEPINLGTSVMIWHSQLRGGLTLMMALMIDPSWSIAEKESPVDNKPILVDATIVVILGFCFLSGTTCPMMLNLCGVPMGVEEEDGSLPYEGVTFDILQRFHAYLKHLLVVDEERKEEDRESNFGRSLLNRRNSMQPVDFGGRY